jgi:multiple sugar transport system substrate-binding protein
VWNNQNLRSKDVTKIYFADNISPALQILIDRFNERYRDEIEVIPINLPFSKFSTNERKELLARSLRSKSDLIDIFAIDLIWSARFAKWVYPLDNLLDSLELENLLSYSLEPCYFEGSLVAVPLYVDVGLMYYRRDLIKEYPGYSLLENQLKNSITWEEFIDLKIKYFSGKEPFYIFPAKNYEGLICSFVELILSQDETTFSNDTIRLNTTEAKRALNLLVDLVNKYQITPAAVVNFDEYQSYLYSLENNALFFRGWPGFMLNHRQIIEEAGKKGLFGIAALPHFKGGNPVSVFGGWNLMISKHSKHTEEAVKFLKFALTKENQEMMYSVGGYLPVNHSVYDDQEFIRQHEYLAYYYTLLKNGVHRPFTPDYTKKSDIISFYINQAIKNELTPEDALAKAEVLINTDKFVIK